MNKQSQPLDAPDQGIAEIIKATVRSIAVSLEIFLHGPMGTRYIDSGIAAILVLYVFRNCFDPSEGSPLYWFTVVYTAVWVCRMTRSIYLLCGSTAWLAITFVRVLAAYNRVLDEYDADPQAAQALMAARYFEVVPSKPAIEGREVTEPAESVTHALPAGVPAVFAPA